MNSIKKAMIGTAILAVGIVMSVAKVQGAVFLSDGFDDGNFTSNPPWSVYDGTGWTVTNDLGRTVLMDHVGAVGTEAGKLFTDLRSPANTGSPITYLQSAGALQLDVTARVLANTGYYYSLALYNSVTDYSYNMFVYTGASLGAIILQKYDGTNHNLAEVDFSSAWPTDQYITLSLVVDPSGTISALTNGVLVVSGSTSPLTSFNEVRLISYNDMAAFDSVQVFERIPEPSVLSFFVLAGLGWGLIHRRGAKSQS